MKKSPKSPQQISPSTREKLWELNKLLRDGGRYGTGTKTRKKVEKDARSSRDGAGDQAP